MLASALLVLMGVLRLPWRRLVWRVSCVCLGAAWSSERLAFALVPVCWRSCGGSLPRWAALGAPCVCLGTCLPGGVVAGVSPGGCLPRRVSCACPGAVWSDGCPALALALLGLASALRLPWCLSAWRSCGVLACDSDLVRQGRGLPYKTGSVKDWFGKTRFSRTNWIRRRISLAQ